MSRKIGLEKKGRLEQHYSVDHVPQPVCNALMMDLSFCGAGEEEEGNFLKCVTSWLVASGEYTEQGPVGASWVACCLCHDFGVILIEQ